MASTRSAFANRLDGGYRRRSVISILSVTLPCESNEQATEKTSNSLREETAPCRIFGVADLSVETQVRVLAHRVFNERKNASTTRSAVASAIRLTSLGPLSRRREDDADGFDGIPRMIIGTRRYDNPSLAGAAPTVVGANRLAVIGFLSFSTAPHTNRMKAVGAPSFETAFGYTSLTGSSAIKAAATNNAFAVAIIFCRWFGRCRKHGVPVLANLRRSENFDWLIGCSPDSM
jgi:hypothetical protein